MKKQGIYVILFVALMLGASLLAGCVEEKERVERKEDVKQNGFEADLARLDAIARNAEREVDWHTVYRSAVELRNLRDKRTEEVFLKILDRKEPIRLRKGSDLPQVMAPLNMLKSIAAESLLDTSGRKHIEVLKRVQKATEEPLLGKMIDRRIKRFEEERHE